MIIQSPKEFGGFDFTPNRHYRVITTGHLRFSRAPSFKAFAIQKMIALGLRIETEGFSLNI